MTILINLDYFCSFITAFGVDAAFSYKYNQQHGICDKDGLAVCPGFTTTHVIPVLLSWNIFDHILLYLQFKYIKQLCKVAGALQL
jgi:hypothetical protein